MKTIQKIINLLEDIITGREGWCGDHGVYTPQLDAKNCRLLLEEIKDIPIEDIGNESVFEMAECADRWEALMSCDRIRHIGSARLGDEFGQVLCVEFHSDSDAKQKDIAVDALRKFTDAMMQRNEYLKAGVDFMMNTDFGGE